MENLYIETRQREDIEISCKNEDNEVMIRIYDCGESQSTYITKDHALQIINHLKDQFGI